MVSTHVSTMVCTHGLYPWSVPMVCTMVSTHGLYPWSVPMVCTHGWLYPWSVPMVGCTHGLYPWLVVPMVGCTHDLYPWLVVPMVSTHGLYPWSVPMVDSHSTRGARSGGAQEKNPSHRGSVCSRDNAMHKLVTGLNLIKCVRAFQINIKMTNVVQIQTKYISLRAHPSLFVESYGQPH